MVRFEAGRNMGDTYVYDMYIHIYIYIFMGVSKNNGTPKWMVYDGKPYFLMDDLGVPLFLETPIYRYTPKIS